MTLTIEARETIGRILRKFPSASGAPFEAAALRLQAAGCAINVGAILRELERPGSVAKLPIKRPVAKGASRRNGPSGLPADAERLLQRFDLSLDSILTVGDSNPKIAKGASLAHVAIHHTLPGRSLAAAVYGPEAGPTAPRSRIDTIRELALANGLGSSLQGFTACPWASQGCQAGCLAWAGHGGLSVNVASCRARRGLARLWAPNVYSVVLLWAIAREYQRAQAAGLPLSVRLKGTDDLPYHLQRFNLSAPEAATLARRYGLPAIPGTGTTLPEVLQVAMADGSLQWYEYSKAPLGGSGGLMEMRTAGLDVTASLAADRKGGARAACGAVRSGFRLAVPVAMAKGAPLPAELLLAPCLSLPALPGTPEFGRVPADDRPVRLQCIDGDSTDLRWLDPSGPSDSFDGIAVILRTKRSRGADASAAAFSLTDTRGAWQALKGGGFSKLVA